MKFNYFHMKIIAILAMTIDHIAWLFIETSSFIGQSMHFIGRITAPMMCYLLVEGFNKSRNLSSYLQRMFIFAILAQIPFIMMLYGIDKFIDNPFILFNKFNILFNFFLAILSLIIIKSNFSEMVKFVILIFFLFISNYIDWGVFIIFFTMVLSLYRNNLKNQIIAYLMTAMLLLLLTDLGLIRALPTLVLQWMPLGILIVPIFWWYGHQQYGSRWGGRYFFYWFYPVHMLILALIVYFLK